MLPSRSAQPSPLDRFLAGEGPDWLPAPHERHWVAEGVSVQLRQDLDKVVLDGAPYYRPDWQGVGRREPRLIRADADRRVCVLWALGRALEERLVLEPNGEIVLAPAPKADVRAPAPLPPVWRPALAALVARESAPVLDAAISAAIEELVLEWGPVPGDLLRLDGNRARVRRQLLDVGLEWIRDAESAAARGERAGALALEVARLLAPELRRRAQARLEALPADEQQRLWEASQSAEAPPLAEAVGRLLALLARGTG